MIVAAEATENVLMLGKRCDRRVEEHLHGEGDVGADVGLGCGLLELRLPPDKRGQCVGEDEAVGLQPVQIRPSGEEVNWTSTATTTPGVPRRGAIRLRTCEYSDRRRERVPHGEQVTNTRAARRNTGR